MHSYRWASRGLPLLEADRTDDGGVPARRPPSRATVQEAAAVLTKLLDTIEAGELDASTPKDIALLRRLQGTLVGWEEALGMGSEEDGHTE